ncbi:MAG: IS66 family insertion sequence element accessory protein TnpB [Clostridia bacterium]
MIDLENVDHVYLYPGSTDLRKGRHSLASLTAKIYRDDNFHDLFIFCNRKNELIKIYEKDETGVWVYIRSLDETRFPWPNNIKEASKINKAQLNWLLRGLKFERIDEKGDIKEELKKDLF